MTLSGKRRRCQGSDDVVRGVGTSSRSREKVKEVEEVRETVRKSAAFSEK